jgi:hypothetical protein
MEQKIMHSTTDSTTDSIGDAPHRNSFPMCATREGNGEVIFCAGSSRRVKSQFVPLMRRITMDGGFRVFIQPAYLYIRVNP